MRGRVCILTILWNCESWENLYARIQLHSKVSIFTKYTYHVQKCQQSKYTYCEILIARWFDKISREFDMEILLSVSLSDNTVLSAYFQSWRLAAFVRRGDNDAQLNAGLLF